MLSFVKNKNLIYLLWHKTSSNSNYYQLKHYSTTIFLYMTTIFEELPISIWIVIPKPKNFLKLSWPKPLIISWNLGFRFTDQFTCIKNLLAGFPARRFSCERYLFKLWKSDLSSDNYQIIYQLSFFVFFTTTACKTETK